MKRVAITGLGVVSPLGNSVETFWSNIKAGKNGITEVAKFDVSDFSCKVAAQVNDFDPQEYIDRKEARRMDRFTQFAIAASKMALENANLTIHDNNAEKTGIILGSGIGGFETLEDQFRTFLNKGPSRVSPFFIPMMIGNMAAAQIAITTGAKGMNETVVTACASATNAIGDAFKVIARGDADIMITGGSEAAITPLSFAGFCSMKAMSTNPDPETACRPFDADRDGFIMGEGAGILILEELEHAKARKAPIIAEMVGYGATDDAYHITSPAPGGEGAARAMQMALNNAGISADKIDYINAHGTSTPYNDKFETEAIKSVFGEAAKQIKVSSTKSMTGHLLGASGGIEAVISAMVIQDSFIPPTIHYQTPDTDCDLDIVPNHGVSQEVSYVLSNSLGFGGHNATIIFKKFEG